MKRLCNMNVSLENKLKQLNDIAEHKKIVFDIGYKLSKKIMETDQDELALNLMKRISLHDLSKLEKDEFYGMAKFVDDMDSLKNSKSSISENKQNIINLHWERNEHHPEYWIDINQMTDLDIMELTIDWFARSIQFGTDMLEFLEQRQKDRFHFPQEIYDKIVKYYYMLKEE